MESSLTIKNILSQVRKLDKKEQLDLLQQLVVLLRKNEGAKSTSFRLSSLSGLGSEVWKDTDLDQYLEDERQW